MSNNPLYRKGEPVWYSGGNFPSREKAIISDVYQTCGGYRYNILVGDDLKERSGRTCLDLSARFLEVGDVVKYVHTVISGGDGSIRRGEILKVEPSDLQPYLVRCVRKGCDGVMWLKADEVTFVPVDARKPAAIPAPEPAKSEQEVKAIIALEKWRSDHAACLEVFKVLRSYGHDIGHAVERAAAHTAADNLRYQRRLLEADE